MASLRKSEREKNRGVERWEKRERGPWGRIERQSAGGNETEQGKGWEERISGKTKSKAKSFF